MRKEACVNLTEVSPLVGLRTEGFIIGQTTLKFVLSKVVKHEKTCSDTFVFGTFGFQAPQTVYLLQKVQRLMHNNVMSLKTIKRIFKRIDFTIQKE